MTTSGTLDRTAYATNYDIINQSGSQYNPQSIFRYYHALYHESSDFQVTGGEASMEKERIVDEEVNKDVNELQIEEITSKEIGGSDIKGDSSGNILETDEVDESGSEATEGDGDAEVEEITLLELVKLKAAALEARLASSTIE